MKGSNITIKNLFQRNLLLIIYLLFSLIMYTLLKSGIAWTYYLILIWFGFGYNRIIFPGKLSFIRNLMLSWFTGSGIVIAFGCLFNFIEIPINQWTLFFMVIFSMGSFVLSNKNFQLKSISFDIDRFDVLVIIITLFALIAKVISIRDFSAPILHDPMSHAEWAKIIVETGFADYFYSPGLHILSAIGEIIGGFDVAKQILIITNIFNALFGLPVYILLKDVYKKNWWSVTSAFIFSLGDFPTTFYITAGKNALIVAIPFVFLVLYYLISNSNRDWKTVLFTNLFIITLLMSHYPTGFIAAIFIGFYYLFNLNQIKKALFLLPSFVISAIWGLTKYLLYEQPITLNPVYTNTLNASYVISFDYVINIIISITRQTIVYIGSGIHADIILILSIFGLLFLIFFSKKNKNLRWILFGLLFFIIFLLSIEIFKLSSIRFIFVTEIIFSFVLYYLSATFIVSEFLITLIKKNLKYAEYIIIILVIVISTLTAKNIYTKYQNEQLTWNMVTKYDMEVFNWIELNLDKNDIILNNGIMGIGGKVFPTDSGAWIPAFAFKKIAIPFSDFSSLNTYENHVIHQELIKDPGNCELLDKLLNKGIEYYYRGRKEIYGPSLTINDKYLESGLYELLYEAREAKLYRINGCDK